MLGSINIDYILSFDFFPIPGETAIGKNYQISFGGKGANQAVSAGRSGANIALIACIGNDKKGYHIRKQLKNDNVDITSINIINSQSTGVSLIFVNAEGDNIIGVYSGANAKLTPDLVKSKQNIISNARILLMQMESPIESILMAAQIAHQNHTKIVLNPAPARILSNELLALVDIITPNEIEAQKLTGIHIKNDNDAAIASEILHQKGIDTVIITSGSQGVWVSTCGKGYRIPSFCVKVIDTIAAGDTFNGALATALLEEKTLYEAIRFASAAAAISVTRRGAFPSIPWRKKIDAFLQQNIKNDSLYDLN